MHEAITRARAASTAAVLAAADVAGRSVRKLPGLAGAAAVCWGLGEVYAPLFWIAAGGFLLLIDREMP